MIISIALYTLAEGLIFGMLALGVYVAFRWTRFPDLTPDGSFAFGAASYARCVLHGIPPSFALSVALLMGGIAGGVTAGVNRFAKVPSVVSGLLVASALYSCDWFLLSKPNQYLDKEMTLAGDRPDRLGILILLGWLLALLTVIVISLCLFANTSWGIRLRAIGENPLLARDVRASETGYIFLGLVSANALVGLAGALFAQRSFSADINMGLGMTITGLAGMILGLLLGGSYRSMPSNLLFVCCGAIVYKCLVFLTLEFGLPAESFRLVSAGVLVIAFFFLRFTRTDFLKGIRWN